MNYKLALFDVDGLVISSELFSKRMEREYGTHWETMRPFFQGVFNQCKLGKADLKTELGKVAPSWNWSVSIDDLLTYWFKDIIINQEVIQIVRDLQKQSIKCYLATNQTHERAAYLMNNLGLSSIFDGIYNSATMHCTKDNPEFFKHILQDQGLEGNEVLFIEHDEQNLKVAETAGVTTLSYTDVPTLRSSIWS